MGRRGLLCDHRGYTLGAEHLCSLRIGGSGGRPRDRDYPLLHLRAGLAQPSPGVFDWERTVADGQLRSAAEIREYLVRSEIRLPGAYRLEGSDAEASFLVYVLRLLGYSEASYDPVSKVLSAEEPNPHILNPKTH